MPRSPRRFTRIITSSGRSARPLLSSITPSSNQTRTCRATRGGGRLLPRATGTLSARRLPLCGLSLRGLALCRWSGAALHRNGPRSACITSLRSALRQDPDVILVGEMRDYETIETAITAAETGHLVFATLHTNDTAQSLDRLIDVFPAERQAQIRVQLANCLTGIVHQQLVPRRNFSQSLWLLPRIQQGRNP